VRPHVAVRIVAALTVVADSVGASWLLLRWIE